ncbi:cell wall-binding repeat-containing protein [Clostridium sp. DJ247]|uniref:cell wall-binding repeat-containing protein n=1 Tax=Clostridium sp. DJ247 TaxID=2726188 RepID=UPI0028BF5010|nr:cell wall-binding repeat-containing protein [Clostridium sp. DJ247]
MCKYFDLDTDNAIVANGENFPDALSGSALAAKLNAPIILTDGQNIADQKDYLDSRHYKNITLLGGSGSIDILTEYALKGSDNVTDEEKDYINKLSYYCNAYADISLNYVQDMNKFDPIAKSLNQNSSNNITALTDFLNKYIDLMNDMKSLNNTYKQKFLDLKDQVSSLQSPGSTELLKTDYINGIDTVLKKLDILIGYMDNFINLCTEIKDAVNSNNINKAMELTQELKTLKYNLDKERTPYVNDITKLRSKLLKIQSYIQ